MPSSVTGAPMPTTALLHSLRQGGKPLGNVHQIKQFSRNERCTILNAASDAHAPPETTRIASRPPRSLPRRSGEGRGRSHRPSRRASGGCGQGEAGRVASLARTLGDDDLGLRDEEPDRTRHARADRPQDEATPGGARPRPPPVLRFHHTSANSVVACVHRSITALVRCNRCARHASRTCGL